ncbi:protein kinase domain-containing protein [Novipirellula artificiosorum]|uniref:Tubulin-like protein n=1 Tax=Novipirellula artificiosorum TaxID=2528016 RepID=A0A5C6DFZ3_9BACT|nr:tubulin-like doman-containing protein [Novipirellula artificiosorum]TWU36203.1 Tubulin-like protein [Novipirellula artificiosorum]
MKAPNSRKICAGYEPILGYRLEKLVGRGGFGEVWRADAPGGIKKAVKFVFGAHDQQRAARELKSLERIKGVSHPFLLTLERFGVVDEQLVIVTELADGSLEDVFREHRERGSCGIPRDKLLSYLHDAADALDYLHQEYQLQHLDIKPGNLLIVGGHVKVADFGLLKDLRDAECSMVGGLTPVYAPPEVFDGRPSLHSDQYSLAVMYQELLTGTRPFSGRTIAQLATQHVHNAPDLEPLPPSDRPAAARALEKTPDRRFTNCRAFIEALMNPRGRVTSPQCTDTELSNSDTDTDCEGRLAGGRDAIEDLPALRDGRVSRDSRSVAKVLLVALGGAGADVLHEIRSRIRSMHSACPIQLHSVLIDTDAATIRAAQIGNSCDSMPACEAISIPLRSPREYRESLTTERLRTISRRWIYNVPRSLETEGMRPLGRLALVDHGERVTESLRRVVAELASDEATTSPKIFVVGSLCGGTGSGIYLDVVHLLRHFLDSHSMEQSTIHSMLAMKGLKHDPALSLAHHDTHSALIEMAYFLQPGNGYPGDAGAGWPSVPAARTPLKHAYLVASNESDPGAPTPVQVIGDYIWTDTTGAGSLLEEARAAALDESAPTIATPLVRSVGIIPLGVFRRPEEEILTPATVRHLLLRWLGHPAQAKQNASVLATRLFRRSGFNSDSFVVQFSRAFGETKVVCQQQLQRRFAMRHHEAKPCEQDRECIDECDGIEVANLISQWAVEIASRKDAIHEIQGVMDRLAREMVTRFTHGSTDVATAIEALRLFQQQVQADRDRLRGQAEMLDDCAHIEGVDSDDHKADGRSHPLQTTPVIDLGMRLIDHMVYRMAAEQVDSFISELDALLSRLEETATTLAIVISRLSDGGDATTNPWDEMPTEVSSQFSKIVSDLHNTSVSSSILRPLSVGGVPLDPNQLQRRLTEAASPLVGSALATASSASVLPSLSVDLATQSMSEVTAMLARQHGDPAETDAKTVPSNMSLEAGRLVGSKEGSDQPVTSMATALQMARPSLLDYGGVQRLILAVGTHSEQVRLEAELRQFHSGALTVTLIPGTTAKLIHEAQQINLNDVIARLATLNAANSQVSSRLMARSDIEWRTSERRPVGVALAGSAC